MLNARKKLKIKDPKEVTTKNGRGAVAGTCSVCGTKVFRIKSKKQSSNLFQLADDRCFCQCSGAGQKKTGFNVLLV